jgi:2-aminoadipate transaminase
VQANYLTHLKRLYSERSEVLVQSLREGFPERDISDVRGGYFIWLNFPAVDTLELLKKAKLNKVAFQPGLKFSSRGKLNNYLRLCFAFYDEQGLQEGVKRLAEVLKEGRKEEGK